MNLIHAAAIQFNVKQGDVDANLASDNAEKDGA